MRERLEARLESLEQERQWVKQAQEGRKEGFAGLYRLHAERLYRQVIFPCLVDQAASEDVLKDTFLTVMQQIKAYRWDETKGIFPWLARIARNRSLDFYRRNSREGRGKGAYRHELDRLEPHRSADELMEEKQEQLMLQESVRECLEKLNPRYRLALELRLFQEFPRTECARRLQVQVGTFDVLFHRALCAFRKYWDKEEPS